MITPVALTTGLRDGIVLFRRIPVTRFSISIDIASVRDSESALRELIDEKESEF
jgi:hypothetical protein